MEVIMKSSMILSGILILGIALTGCATSGDSGGDSNCLKWENVEVGKMPSGAPQMKRQCTKWKDEAKKSSGDIY